MQLEFPIEFVVTGTPVSSLARRAQSRDEWTARVRAASAVTSSSRHTPSDDRIAATLFYFPDYDVEDDMGDVATSILQALSQHIYLSPSQVERVVVQKFEPGSVFEFRGPSETLQGAFARARPSVYVRLSNDPFEEAR